MVKMTPEERRAVASKGGKARAAEISGVTLSESGKKGGKARAAKLTPQRRSEIAKKASNVRWAKRRGKPSR